MEHERELAHLSDDRLAGFWAGTLSPDALEALVDHVDACAACAARFDRIEPAFAECRWRVDGELAGSRRDRRREKRLWKRMRDLEAQQRPRMAWRPIWALGFGAAVLILAISVLPRGGGMEARAETLLTQSARATRRPAPERRLRVRTRRGSFERPARLAAAAAETAGTALLRARFEQTHYNWNDPLSAQSFLDWHRTRIHKTIQIRTGRDPAGRPEQTIETKTDDGTLADASLTLDAALAPVSARFEFTDHESVEIAAELDFGSNAAPAPPVAEVLPVTPVLRPYGQAQEPMAERELRTLLAIDSLGADPGEPIDVDTTDDRGILVTTYGLGADLEAKLQASLETIPGVTLRSVAGQHAAAANLAEPHYLLARSSQELSFEAYRLADLANRFDVSAEAAFSPASRTALRDLRRRHTLRLSGYLTKLRQGIEQLHPEFRARVADALESAPSGAVAQCAARLNRLITELFAGGVLAAERRDATQQLEVEVGRMQLLVERLSAERLHREDLP